MLEDIVKAREVTKYFMAPLLHLSLNEAKHGDEEEATELFLLLSNASPLPFTRAPASHFNAPQCTLSASQCPWPLTRVSHCASIYPLWRLAEGSNWHKNLGSAGAH